MTQSLSIGKIEVQGALAECSDGLIQTLQQYGLWLSVHNNAEESKIMQITPNEHEAWVDDVLHDFFPENKGNKEENGQILEHQEPNNQENTLA